MFEAVSRTGKIPQHPEVGEKLGKGKAAVSALEVDAIKRLKESPGLKELREAWEG